MSAEELRRSLEGPLADFVGRLIGAALILGAGWLALHFLVGPLRRLLERSRIDPSAASFLANTIRTALLAAVILGVLSQLGVQTASLLTLLGTAGLAVALSLQNSLANFASGLLVLAFRMVRVGDSIELGDVRGRVAEMLPFHIVLVTADNQRITVPNTMLTSTAVRNNSALPMRRVQWTVPVAAGDDLNAVKEALRERVLADPRILRDPAPQLHVQEWTEDRRLVVVQAWTATTDYQAVQQDLTESLGARLAELRRGAQADARSA
jgi:small conductance mechanosensitive channel